jgi:hypothetical protein
MPSHSVGTTILEYREDEALEAQFSHLVHARYVNTACCLSLPWYTGLLTE